MHFIFIVGKEVGDLLATFFLLAIYLSAIAACKANRSDQKVYCAKLI